MTLRRRKPVQPVGKCSFCEEKKEPDYADTAVLLRFITDRGKIFSRSRSALCAKHQRRLADHIKYARQLALIPYLIRE